MSTRLVALILMSDDHPPSRHFLGMPAAAGRSTDSRIAMPWPRVVMISEKDDGFYLERYLPDGSIVGDTWHEEMEHAKEQAEKEYGRLLGTWTEVPQDLSDDEAIVLALSSQS